MATGQLNACAAPGVAKRIKGNALNTSLTANPFSKQTSLQWWERQDGDEKRAEKRERGEQEKAKHAHTTLETSRS